MVVRTVCVLRKPRLRTPPLKESISRNNSMTFDELQSNFQNVRKQFKEADTLPPILSRCRRLPRPGRGGKKTGRRASELLNFSAPINTFRTDTCKSASKQRTLTS